MTSAAVAFAPRRQRVRRRSLAALALLAGLATSCAAPTRAGDPRRLTIAVSADAGPLNPYLGAPDTMLNLVYDKLFEPSPFVEQPQPALAEEARQIDPVTWMVRLRDGVQWHDGRPFTADDVRFTYEYYRDGPPTRHGHHVSAVPRIDRIEIVGPRELRFVCGYPCPTLDRVTLADLPILPSHVWSRIREPRKHTDLPVGTGPYRLVAYESDRFYRFEAHERYFLGRPMVDEIVMPVVPDITATFIALRTGELDAAARPLPPELIGEFTRTAGLKVMRTAALSIVELRPNYGKAPFADPEFRRALSLAVDRQALVDTVLLSHGRPGNRGYPHPDSPWTNPASSTPFDRAEASGLFDRLGFRDRNADGVREDSQGRDLHFSLKVASGTPAWIRLGEILARQLTGIGLPTTLQTLEAGVFTQQVQAREFDLFISEIGSHGAADPDQFVMSQLSGYLWRPDLPNPGLMAMIERWKQAETLETRRQVGFELQDLFNREPTSIALLYPDAYWAYRPAAFDQWIDSPGYGIVHKWSFLPPAVRPAGLGPAS